MSAIDTNGVAKVCAAIDAGDGAVMLYDDEMRDVVDALDGRERAIGRERTRAEAAEAEVARLRAAFSAWEAATRTHDAAIAALDALLDRERAGEHIDDAILAAMRRRDEARDAVADAWTALRGTHTADGRPTAWPVPA